MKLLLPKLILSSLILTLLLSFGVHKKEPVLKFLNALDKEQLEKIRLPFDDTSRTSWHFLPPSMYPREGLTLGELTDTQKDLFSKMFMQFLSESGYEKTKKIINLENILIELGGDPNFRDANKYFIAIYGNPKTDTYWAWSFEGHHISLNFTISNNKISASPRFFGANPAIVKKGANKDMRTLHREEKLAYILINSMTDAQKDKVIFRDTAFKDIITSHDSKVDPLKPVGITAQKLNSEQKQKLKAIINEYLSALPKHIAKTRANKIYQEAFNAIRFGWAGSTEKGEPHYYRIQGKTFLIELDNTQNNANHIHCVWRDFDGDFGRDIIKEHYKNTKHHTNK